MFSKLILTNKSRRFNRHFDVFWGNVISEIQRQSPRGVPREKCSENMQQQSYRRTRFEIALRDGCSPVNLLHIFRPPFPNMFLRTSLGGCFWKYMNTWKNLRKLIQIWACAFCLLLDFIPHQHFVNLRNPLDPCDF